MGSAKNGFTLIELVVVMAIIAVLAALMVAAISGARKQSVATQNQGNARTVEAAMETYAASHNGRYQTTVNGKTFSAITLTDLPALSSTITGGCSANGGGVVTSATTSTFMLTYYDSSCATSANDKTIIH